MRISCMYMHEQVQYLHYSVTQYEMDFLGGWFSGKLSKM